MPDGTSLIRKSGSESVNEQDRDLSKSTTKAMITTLHILQGAGIILFCIAIANVFAPRKMNWIENLKHVDSVFKQVFITHCVFLVMCVVAMAIACVFFPQHLLDGVLGRSILGFMGFFWSARLMVQLFYYEANIKRAFPGFHLLFSASFLYLAVSFTYLTLQSR